jgi:phenylpropionate dioxygenase-like ring-hydroxylating dioxygenase large terminal subunit
MTMNIKNMHRAVEGIRRSADEGLGLDAECYRDPAFFELEVERVLRPGWHPIARWDDLPETGDYLAIELFGESLVVLRGEDRNLHVFSNVCRHRAHTVVKDSGNARSLVCPYHRWSYGLDGGLRAAPLMKGTKGFERAQYGLPELRTETWQGFLFVSLDADASPFADELGGLDDRLESKGLGDMVSLGVLDFDSPWNWKVMIDNFMESYHHLGIHIESLQKTNPAKGTYSADVTGPFSLLENPGVEDDASFLVAQVFPTLLFSVVDQPRFAVWYEMQIDRHDHFHLRIHAMAPPEIAAAEGVAEMLSDTLTKIHLEDIEACREVQRGLASRLWKPGPLNVREHCLSRFHHFLAEQLRE